MNDRHVIKLFCSQLRISKSKKEKSIFITICEQSPLHARHVPLNEVGGRGRIQGEEDIHVTLTLCNQRISYGIAKPFKLLELYSQTEKCTGFNHFPGCALASLVQSLFAEMVVRPRLRPQAE